MLGFKPLRRQKVLWEETDAFWDDEGALCGPKVCWSGHIVGLFYSLVFF